MNSSPLLPTYRHGLEHGLSLWMEDIIDTFTYISRESNTPRASYCIIHYIPILENLEYWHPEKIYNISGTFSNPI